MPDTTILRQTIAKRRLIRARQFVEEAQHTLERACTELSVINGGYGAQVRVRKIADRAHAEWYRLEKVANSKHFNLDHQPHEYDRRDFPDLFKDEAPAADGKTASTGDAS